MGVEKTTVVTKNKPLDLETRTTSSESKSKPESQEGDQEGNN